MNGFWLGYDSGCIDLYHTWDTDLVQHSHHSKQCNHLGNNETTVVSQVMAQLLLWHDQRSREERFQAGEWSDAAYTGYQTKQFY